METKTAYYGFTGVIDSLSATRIAGACNLAVNGGYNEIYSEGLLRTDIPSLIEEGIGLGGFKPVPDSEMTSEKQKIEGDLKRRSE